MSDIPIPAVNAPQVFKETQQAALDEVNASRDAAGDYATQFRLPSSVVSGPHADDGIGPGFSDAQKESFAQTERLCETAQTAINDGPNGVVGD